MTIWTEPADTGDHQTVVSDGLMMAEGQRSEVKVGGASGAELQPRWSRQLQVVIRSSGCDQNLLECLQLLMIDPTFLLRV